jgi:hypothetical protein
MVAVLATAPEAVCNPLELKNMIAYYDKGIRPQVSLERLTIRGNSRCGGDITPALAPNVLTPT